MEEGCIIRIIPGHPTLRICLPTELHKNKSYTSYKPPANSATGWPICGTTGKKIIYYNFFINFDDFLPPKPPIAIFEYLLNKNVLNH